MDGISDDPELAQELLKLLHAKLRDARQELQDQRRTSKSEIALLDSTDLQRQNEELKDELTSLRLRLSAAAEREDTKEGFAGTSTPDEGMQERLLAVQKEKAAIDRDIQERKQQLKKYKSKSEKLCADIVHLEETMSVLQADIEQETKENESCALHILAVEKELCILGPPVATTQPFDIDAFLHAEIEPFDFPELSSFQSLLKSTPLLELPQEILERFGPMELLVLPPDNVMWSKEGIDRAVFVTQSHHYDPTARGTNGSWEVNPSMSDLLDGIGRSRELFVRQHNDCYYYGTYRCTGHSSISGEASQELAPHLVRHVTNTTATHKDHLAPLALKFVDSLYINGPLELQCFAFERVAFNHGLHDALLYSIKAFQVVNSLAAKHGKIATSVVRKLRPREKI
ncbi:hypothetical protein TRAPUB_10778 [Trametes pubescens]|uniref:DUF6697 domain-containing protein n=1 Tax=Trametes pubescens TaxID=154538 RepID=A0A1M2VYR5_TRAPU|nr:hypothetical protein TRAPUB_10778 [Trametes pubescens]